MHILVLISLCFFTWWVLQKVGNYRNGLPPGPFRFPGIGSVIQCLIASPSLPPLAFHKMRKYYGDVISIQTGTVFFVVANGYDAIREVELNDDMLDRGAFDWILDRTYGKKLGLIFSDGTCWNETRLYTIRTLRDFGFGKTYAMEQIIKDELEEFVAVFKEKVESTNQDRILNMTGVFNTFFVNVVWLLIHGERFPYRDPKFQQLLDLVHDVTKSGKFGGGLLGSYPFLQKYAPVWSGFTQYHEANVAIVRYFEDMISKVKRKGEYKTDPVNFIEIFLNCIDAFDPDNTDDNKSDPMAFYVSNSRRRSSVISIFNLQENIFTKENLVSIIYDLFFIGCESSSNVLSFAMVYLIRHQDIQQKIRDEIDNVVGRDRNITAIDKKHMPYTEATVLEALRISSVVPISPRITSCRTNIGKFTIPANTMVLTNIYSSNMDEKLWDNPTEFRPERFLNPSQNQIINGDKLLSFGSGKRNCMAEAIARLTLFLALGNLIQNFTFEVDPSTGPPSTEMYLGLTSSPMPFTSLVKCRN